MQETIARRGRAGHGGQARRRKASAGASDHVAALEQEFRTALGVRVKITHDARGRGKVVIAFASHEEFDQVHRHICGGAKPTHGSSGVAGREIVAGSFPGKIG